MYALYKPFLTRIYFTLQLVFVFCFVAHAQQTSKQSTLSGIVWGADLNTPLPYASISIYAYSDSLITGGLSDEEGRFIINISEGQYYALIEFMGYESFKTEKFSISKDSPTYDLGKIVMNTSAENLNEVVVQGEKTLMELSLDKRIFNVGKDLANAGGTANDILMNLPSVAVDPEGNVRLRGSSNVRILIDGKPSGLVSFKGSSGLRQLPANMVERVEVITNPSARYEAEGMAGVINIILKKDNNQGFNASFELIAGAPTNLGFTANLNYRHKKINWFVNYGFAYRRSPNVAELYQEVYDEDITLISNQTKEGNVKSLNNNIRGGLDYYFSEKSILTLSYLWRRSDAHRITDIRYDDSYLTNSIVTPEGYTLRRQDETEQEPNSEISANYRRQFDQNGHELTGTVTYLNYWENSDQTFTQQSYYTDGNLIAGSDQLQTSLNDEYENQYLAMLDYVKPFGDDGKFESGFRTSFRDMKNDYIVQEADENGNFTPIPGLDNIFIYNENILAAYGIIGNKTNNWSYQAGLRAEYTDVKTILQETNEVNPRSYTNLFPSAHLTYNISQENAFQLSYSRRVRRPVYNDLSPYVTFSDARNFFSGNPDLNPEYTNSFELGHIKYFEKGTLFTTMYYRSSIDKIDRLRTVDEVGFSVTKPYNLNGENSFGVEISSDYKINDWWKLDFNVNFFHANIDGTNIQADYKTKTYSWLFRQTSRFSISNGIELQVRANYEAPQKTVQGLVKGLFYMDLSASKKILNDRVTLTLNAMDIFNSRKNRFINEGATFYTEGSSQNQRRQINLTLAYRLKQ